MKIDLKDLGPCLKAYREYRDIKDIRIIEKRLGNVGSQFRIRSLRSLENGKTGGEFSLPDLKELLAAYEMSELMVDHLLVENKEEYVVNQAISSFDPHPATTLFQSNAEYSIPTCLLRPGRSWNQPFPHAFFVRVELKRQGDHSEKHHHPGDEITICLKGKVRMSWCESGLFTELDPGDYVHFYADQEHIATNIGMESAELFVVRNYMIAGGGPRRKLYKDAKDFDDALLQGRKDVRSLRKSYREGIGRYTNQMFRSRSSVPTGDIHLQDPIGLSRQLDRLKWYGRKLKRHAKERLREKALPPTRYEEFISGFSRKAATRKEIEQLAEVCNIPAVLLYPFMFPRVPAVCVIRLNEDFVELPVGDNEQSTSVRYSYPRHNLADSGLTISRLELAPDHCCPENKHTGTELCLLLGKKGTSGGGILMDLYVPKEKSEGSGLKRISKGAKPGEYLHYVSEHTHKLTNCSQSSASMLVIRFFE